MDAADALADFYYETRDGNEVVPEASYPITAYNVPDATKDAARHNGWTLAETTRRLDAGERVLMHGTADGWHATVYRADRQPAEPTRPSDPRADLRHAGRVTPGLPR
ncbi:MAG: hypothetical protein ACYC61_15885 [Isosphaeraceae bacterium]